MLFEITTFLILFVLLFWGFGNIVRRAKAFTNFADTFTPIFINFYYSDSQNALAELKPFGFKILINRKKLYVYSTIDSVSLNCSDSNGFLYQRDGTFVMVCLPVFEKIKDLYPHYRKIFPNLSTFSLFNAIDLANYLYITNPVIDI